MLANIANLYLTENKKVFTIIDNIFTISLLSFLHFLIWLTFSCLCGVMIYVTGPNVPIIEIRILSLTVIGLLIYIITDRFRKQKRKLEQETYKDAMRIYNKTTEIAKLYSTK